MTNKQSITLVTTALIFLGGIIFFLLFSSLFSFSSSTATNNNTIDSGNDIVLKTTTNDPLVTPVAKVYKSFIRPDDPMRGTQNAQLTILEFGDYGCPYCAQIYENLNKIINNYPGKIKLVWKDFANPIHLNAKYAAMAARCAADQGKFWEYHDYLFENQDKLSRELYNQIASELNLDLAKFNKCYESNEKMELIGQGLEDGQRLGVEATPTLFIGNNKIDFALTYDELKEVVEYELRNQ